MTCFDAKLGNRTVWLVKNGDGIATTTFHGTKGARVDQIKAAMDAKHWMTATASLIQLHRTVA